MNLLNRFNAWRTKRKWMKAEKEVEKLTVPEDITTTINFPPNPTINPALTGTVAVATSSGTGTITPVHLSGQCITNQGIITSQGILLPNSSRGGVMWSGSGYYNTVASEEKITEEHKKVPAKGGSWQMTLERLRAAVSGFPRWCSFVFNSQVTEQEGKIPDVPLVFAGACNQEIRRMVVFRDRVNREDSGDLIRTVTLVIEIIPARETVPTTLDNLQSRINKLENEPE